MIHIYYATCETLGEINESLLEPVRCSKLALCKQEARKKELRAAGELLRLSLKEVGYTLTEEPLQIKYSCYGKPYLEESDWFYSLSHSGDYVVCAVAKQELGVDIEVVKDISPKLADKILKVCERQEYDQILGNSEKNQYLIERWTRKESVLKAMGCGIRYSMKEVPYEDYVLVTTRLEKECILSLAMKEKEDFIIKKLP